jgi:two-component system sensor histidine kinase ChiS
MVHEKKSPFGTDGFIRIVLRGSFRKPWRRCSSKCGFYALQLAIICLALCSSCKHAPTNRFSEQEEDSINNIVSAKNNIDSLKSMLAAYTKSGNRMGAIITCRVLGKRFRDESHFTDAIEYHRKGLAYSVQLCDTPEIIRALNNIGTNFRRLGILDEASSYHYKALAYCAAYNDKKSHKAIKNRLMSLNGIGNVQLTLGNDEVADSVFRLALAGERFLSSSEGQAINYANIGSIYENNNQNDSARFYYNLSMKKNREAHSDIGISLCYIHFGALYEKQHLWDDAIREYKAAYHLMENRSDRWHWLEACNALANAYIEKNELSAAETYLKKALATADSIQSLEHLADIYKLYYKWYDKQGNSKKALECYIKSRAYGDSISNEKSMNHLQNVRIDFERTKQQSKINLLQQNYEAKQQVKNVLIIVALTVLALVVTIVFFLSYALRNRARRQHMMRMLDDARANFFTNVTHEFRTPLTVILGFSKLLQKGELPEGETLAHIGTMITRQGNSLLNLINQLLDISKVRSAIGEPDWHTGNIVPYLRMIVERSQDGANQKRISLVFRPEQTEIVMDFVPDYIRKIIQNLLSNAMKFTPEYGHVTLTAGISGSNVCITVSDTGKGIDKKDLPHIFESFYQGSNHKAEIGTGIGLSLVNQLVKAMNGTITANSTPDKGSTFVIEIPLQYGKTRWKTFSENEDAQSQASNDNETNPPKGNEADTVPMILIVEDNTDVSYFIGSQLRGRYHLYYAINGNDGLNKAKDLIPDLIITDLMMPGMDGFGLCKNIRSSELLNHIPIIIITAKSTEADRIKGLETGADAYLYKPFDSGELNVRVERLLDSRRTLREKYSQALQKGKENETPLNKNDQDFLNRLTDVTYAFMTEGATNVEQIASKMCMSRSQLNRKIVAITGENTTAYLIHIKLSKAKRLLDAPENLPIGDIAMKCGFEDCAYFSRLFKQTFDMTPSQYRKRVK